MDNAFLFDYDHEAVQKKIENSLREEGYEDGVEAGIQKGLKKKALESAKIMLDKGYNISDIKEITKLSELEINNLNK